MDNIILQAHLVFAYLILLLVAVFIIALVKVMLGNSGKVNKLLRSNIVYNDFLSRSIFSWTTNVICSPWVYEYY